MSLVLLMMLMIMLFSLHHTAIHLLPICGLTAVVCEPHRCRVVRKLHYFTLMASIAVACQQCVKQRAEDTTLGGTSVEDDVGG